MNKDGIPLPSALTGNMIERLVRIDEALFFLILGALVELTDDWRFEQTGTLTVDDTRLALMDMLWCFQEACDVTPVGLIQMWPTATPPDRWLICDASSVLRADYPALFNVIGTIYGSVDGTHFNLPDMQNRSPMGVGSFIALGGLLGAATHTLNSGENGVHSHGVTDIGHIHYQQIGASPAYLAVGGSGRAGYAAVGTSSLQRVETDTGGGGITIQNSAGGNPHNNVHPVIGLNYIIYAGE